MTHPYVVGKIQAGDVGARESIAKVAKIATLGRMDPVVRKQAIRFLVAAGNPKTIKGKVEAIREGVRRALIYVPDPVWGEFIASARELLSGEDYLGGDCDDHSVAILSAVLAAIESVGITAVAVGHSYNASRTLEHVLVAVWDPDEEKWWYADGTTSTPFGEWPMIPTWEYVITAPGLAVLCDAELCLRGEYAARPEVLTMDGDYVGAAGLPRPEALGLGAVATPPDVAPYLAKVRAELADAWDSVLDAYGTMASVYGILGKPLLDPNAPPVDLAKIGNVTSWGPDMAQRLLDLQSMKDFATMVLDQAISGKRQVALEKGDYAIQQLPTDTLRLAMAPSGPVLEDIATGAVVHGKGPILGVGAAPAILAALWPYAVLVGVVLVIIWICGAVETVAKKTTQTTAVNAYAECLKSANPPACMAQLRQVIDETNKQPPGPAGEAAGLVRSLTWLGVLAGLTYGAVKLFPLLTTRRTAAAA